MADADTTAKRGSMIALAEPAGVNHLIIPDGTVGTPDRLHLLGLYSGIAADAPAAAVGFSQVVIIG